MTTQAIFIWENGTREIIEVSDPPPDEPEQCSQCGAVVEGHHACQGVPGGFGEDEES